MSRVMITAAEARVKAQWDFAILREIRDLEEAVVVAANAGEYEVIVRTTATMAKDITDTGQDLAVEYCNTWLGTRDDRAKSLQMNKVIQYFSDLGYTIDHQINPNTQITFQWVVAW